MKLLEDRLGNRLGGNLRGPTLIWVCSKGDGKGELVRSWYHLGHWGRLFSLTTQIPRFLQHTRTLNTERSTVLICFFSFFFFLFFFRQAPRSRSSI